MHFGALGDIHGDFEAVRRIMRRHPEVPFWICVGDVATDRGEYEQVDAPLHWIKGNNESFDAIESGSFPRNLHYLAQATAVSVEGIRVAGLGGTFAPTWYDTPASELPHPKKGSLRATQLADKRRHLVRAEVERCKTLRDVDVFMTHEAPRPFFVGGVAGRRGLDAGRTAITEALAGMRPRLHLFGHHHRFSEEERHGVPSIGLDLVSASYLIIDGTTLEYQRVSYY